MHNIWNGHKICEKAPPISVYCPPHCCHICILALPPANRHKRCELLFSGCKMHCPHKKHLGFNGIFVFHLPSLNKSTYGFCGHKYRPTLRVALTGASLPTAPRFLWRHFSRAKTPQDFSARENRMMTRKRTPAYWRMLLRGPRKVVRPRGERRSDEALEGCLFRRNSAPT